MANKEQKGNANTKKEPEALSEGEALSQARKKV